MTVDDLKREYGSIYRAVREIGISTGNGDYWKRKGYIPINTQLRIQEATNGRLKASLDDCKRIDK